MDRLVEIGLEELVVLRDAYRKCWPNNEIGYYVLNNYVNWLKKEPNLKDFYVYCLNGCWNDGTYLLIHGSLIHGHTLDNESRLKTALSLLDLNPKKHYRYFYGESQRATVQAFVKDRSLLANTELEFLLFHLLPEEASKIVVPTLARGFIAKQLSVDDVRKINRDWQHVYPGCEERLQCMREYNVNIGIYTESGELVAWCMRYEYGGNGILYVRKSYRKHGFGRYLVNALTKQIADLGEIADVAIAESNILSRELFESIGFKRSGKFYYLEINPSE